MNKFFRLVLLCAGLASHSYAQNTDFTQDDDTSYWYNNKAAFEHLELERIPSGILMDYGISFADMEPFDGQSLNDSNEMDIVTFEQINASLLSAQIGETSGLSFSPAMPALLKIEQPIKAPLDPQVLYRNLQQDIEYNHIKIAGLLYSYQQIDPARQGNLSAENNALYDTYDSEGNWQDPYTTRNVFAMALSASMVRSHTVTVEMPANLWQTNRNALLTGLTIDADDGLGWRAVSLGDAFQIQYTTDGAKHWKFKATLSDGSIWWGNGGPLVVQNETADFETTITGTTPYLDGVTSAHISIDYAVGNSSLKKPLIIVEGFDPGDVLIPGEQYGMTDIQHDFQIEFNALYDPTNPIPNKLYQEVNNNLYDRVYVDWDNGSDYLECNANLLKDIIKWVNDTKNNSEQSVLWGFSMGGVIGRYALKDLEDDGYNHQVRLFISHDAPQQGANVPYGAQVMAAHFLNLDLDYGQVLNQVPAGSLPVSGSATVTQALSLGMRPAAQEMLIQQFRFAPPFFYTPYNLDGPALHSAWQLKLKNKGYPALCRNIAVSNGSECGVPQALGQPLFAANTDLYVSQFAQAALALIPAINFVAYGMIGSSFSLPQISLPGIFNLSNNWSFIPGANRYTADFSVRSNYDNINTNVYKGRLKYKKSVWLLPDITAFNSQWTANVTAKSWDAFPGGAYSNDLGNGQYSENVALYNPLTGSVATIAAVSASYSVAPHFGFVPTVSALDLGNNNNNTPSSVYYSVITGPQPPASPNNTPFDNFITAYAPIGSVLHNEEHIAITNRNAEFVGQEIAYNDTTSTNSCTNACPGKQISGKAMICPGSYIVYDIPFLPNGTDSVTWSISPTPSAPLVVNGNECKVTNTNASDAGDYTLTATIHTACGAAHFTKQIHMGYPAFWLAVTEVANQGEVVSLGPDCVPGIGQVQWNAPYVSNQTQTTPINSYGWPCWFFNHTFTATSDFYPVTVNATVITPCGATQLSLAYTYDAGSGGPNPNSPYSSGNAGSGSGFDDPSDPYSPAGLKDDHMTISPNPAKNYWNLNGFGKSGTYSLSDITGKVIINKKSFRNNASIKAGKLIKGIYLLRVQTSNGTKTFKLVKA